MTGPQREELAMKKLSYLLATAVSALAAVTVHAATPKANNEGFAAGQAAGAPSQLFAQSKAKEEGYGKPQPRPQPKEDKLKVQDKAKVKVEDTFKKNQGVQKQKF